MDFYEASSEIETTELQLQNCDEISEEKIGAYKGQSISERNFGFFKSPKKRTKFLKDFCPRDKICKIKRIKASTLFNTPNKH